MTPLSAPMSRLVRPAGSSSSSRMRRNLACLSTDFRNSATAHSVSARVTLRGPSSGSDGGNGEREAQMPPDEHEGDGGAEEPSDADAVDDAGEPPTGAHEGPRYGEADRQPAREIDQRELPWLGQGGRGGLRKGV